MSVEKIIDKIIGEAEKEAKKIMNEASNAADKIVEEAKQKAKSAKTALLEKGEKAAQEERRKMLLAAELDFRKEILNGKQSVISQIFDRVSQKFKQLKDNEYKEIIGKMLIAAAQTGDEEIIISSNDKGRINAAFLQKVNAELSKKGKKGNLKLSSDTRDISGGFIYRQGKIEINNSFDALIKSKKDDLEFKIAGILFSSEK